MSDKMTKFLYELAENKLAVAVISALVGAVFTKLLPFLWSGLRRMAVGFGRLAGGRLAYRSFEKSYLNWIVLEYRELKLTGVVSSEEAKKPKLEQVFVSLSLSQEPAAVSAERLGPYIPSGACSFKEAERLLCILEKSSSYFRLSMARRELRKLRAGLGLRQRLLGRFRRTSQEAEKEIMEAWFGRWKGDLRKPIEDSQLRYILGEHSRIAMLGAPGAGKTTLLQYIALACARSRAGDQKLNDKGRSQREVGILEWRLPLFVRLSSVAGMLLADADEYGVPSLLDAVHKTLPPDLQRERSAKSYLERQVRAGRCIFLFDGLDEVPSDSEFQAVARAIQSLIVSFPGNQYIISSRIAGWRGGIRSELALFYVNELTDRQVDVFVDTWYSAVEQNAVVGNLADESAAEREARKRRAEQRASDLKATLAENIGIRRLATSPMLLSIIALVHRSLATLPKERSKLYDQCTKILLEQWDISRGIRVDDTNLKLEQKEIVMRRLAIAFHTGEIGDSDGGREASRQQVVSLVGTLMPGMGRAPEDAARLLNRLVERSGVLVERRRGVLSFAHHTFQEYFAAQYLAIGEREEHMKFLLSAERIHSDWWHEVILLYAGLLLDCSDFIGGILGVGDDDIFLRRVRLAGLCLGEALEVRRTELRELLVCQLLSVKEQALSARLEGKWDPAIGSFLVRWARGPQWLLNACALTSGGVKPESEESVFRQLSSAVKKDDRTIRAAALEGIRSLPQAPSELAEEVLRCLGDESEDVAVRALLCLLDLNARGASLTLEERLVVRVINSAEFLHAARSVPLPSLMKLLSRDVLVSVFGGNRPLSFLFSAKDVISDLELGEAEVIFGEAREINPLNALVAAAGLFDKSEGIRAEASRYLEDFLVESEISWHPGTTQSLCDLMAEPSLRSSGLILARKFVQSIASGGASGRSGSVMVLTNFICRSLDGGLLLSELILCGDVALWRLVPALNEYWAGGGGANSLVDSAVMPALAKLGRSLRTSRRVFAAHVMGILANGEESLEVVGRLRSLTRDLSTDVRCAALSSLSRYAKVDPQAIFDTVVAALADRSLKVRSTAVRASLELWDMVTAKTLEAAVIKAATISMPRVIGGPFDSRYDSYLQTLRALAARAASLDSFALLLDIYPLRNEGGDGALMDEFVRLGREIGGGVGGAIVERLRVKIGGRYFLLSLVAELYKYSEWPGLEEVVVQLLTDESPDLRRSALMALKEIMGPSRKGEFLQAALRQLEDGDQRVRENAWELLKALGCVRIAA